MTVTPSIVQHEFIGLETNVVKSSNPDLVGITGKVVDETRNTFTILHDNKEKVVVKEIAVFDFALPDGTIVEMDGKVIMGRSEDRLKKRPRRIW
ncbi:ribonuclease P protein component 1 [Thermoproteota archaeon]